MPTPRYKVYIDICTHTEVLQLCDVVVLCVFYVRCLVSFVCVFCVICGIFGCFFVFFALSLLSFKLVCYHDQIQAKCIWMEL